MQLDAWLDFHRQTLLLKCAGLSASQLKARTAEPSSLTLLGLLRHMTEVERSWFRMRFDGQPVGLAYSSEANWDGDFDDVDTADPEADFALFAAEVEAAQKAAAGHSLEETYRDSRHDADISLRWIYLHMIEEYARHNGHADLLRERIDGVTGT
jgi:uncharacterized damage-inducible protein DinB